MEGPPVAATHSLDELQALILEVLREDLLEVGDEFGAKSDLIAAGLDSLTAVQLLLAIEERTGIWVDESELTPDNLVNVEALARCVHGHLGA
jgi:acyl carrier protein